MSDSSIPSDILDRDTIKSRQEEERQALFREQSEWYRFNTTHSERKNQAGERIRKNL